MNDQELMNRVVARCGAASVVPPEQAEGRSLSPFGACLGRAAILRPASTEQVAWMVELMGAHGRALVPMGGATGLVGGLAPGGGQAWYLSTERMRRIEVLDADSRIAIVQAGVVLEQLQAAAAHRDLMFPVDLGARGSASIGGLIATNAGGERVLRFGMMREQVLGLEVVLADGRVLDLMDEVVKNNAGYDIKQLFIGSEGTLGIVTRAVLRLRPALEHREAALVALRSLSDLPGLLSRVESALGGSLSAFELMWPDFYDLMTAGPAPRHRPPVQSGAAAYVLFELEEAGNTADPERLVGLLETLMEAGLAADVVVAKSIADRQAFWAIRNDIEHLIHSLQPLHSYDVSVPVGKMAAYVEEVRAGVRTDWPDARVVVFGHVADNNLHVVVGGAGDVLKSELDRVIYEGVRARRGSISAEHGIGVDKRAALVESRPAEVIGLMRNIKTLLDPRLLLNPGKVVEPGAPRVRPAAPGPA